MSAKIKTCLIFPSEHCRYADAADAWCEWAFRLRTVCRLPSPMKGNTPLPRVAELHFSGHPHPHAPRDTQSDIFPRHTLEASPDTWTTGSVPPTTEQFTGFFCRQRNFFWQDFDFGEFSCFDVFLMCPCSVRGSGATRCPGANWIQFSIEFSSTFKGPEFVELNLLGQLYVCRVCLQWNCSAEEPEHPAAGRGHLVPLRAGHEEPQSQADVRRRQGELSNPQTGPETSSILEATRYSPPPPKHAGSQVPF